MRDTNYFLDEIKRKHNLPSDYALAKMLNIKQNKISMYRAGTSTFDSDLALPIAELSGHSAAEILLNMKAQKAKDPAIRKAWLVVAKQLSNIPKLGAILSTGIAAMITQVIESKAYIYPAIEQGIVTLYIM